MQKEKVQTYWNKQNKKKEKETEKSLEDGISIGSEMLEATERMRGKAYG